MSNQFLNLTPTISTRGQLITYTVTSQATLDAALQYFELNEAYEGSMLSISTAGTYTFSGINNLVNYQWQIRGDTRAGVGQSLCDNISGLNAGLFGSAGDYGLTGVAGAATLTVTGSVTNPDFDVAGRIVAGDSILVCHDDGTSAVYTVLTAVNNVLTFTGNLSANVSNTGTSMTLLPNIILNIGAVARTINNKANGVLDLVGIRITGTGATALTLAYGKVEFTNCASDQPINFSRCRVRATNSCFRGTLTGQIRADYDEISVVHIGNEANIGLVACPGDYSVGGAYISHITGIQINGGRVFPSTVTTMTQAQGSVLAASIGIQNILGSVALTTAFSVSYFASGITSAEDISDQGINLANNTVDFDRGTAANFGVDRQGGSATDWTVGGTNDYSNSYLIQVGRVAMAAGAGAATDVAITYPVAYNATAKSILFSTVQCDTKAEAQYITSSTDGQATGGTITVYNSHVAQVDGDISWMSIGIPA